MSSLVLIAVDLDHARSAGPWPQWIWCRWWCAWRIDKAQW